MRKIRDISEDEMISIFLQTEFHSSRFHQTIEALARKVGIDPHILQAPDWHNASENTQRRMLLGVYRGYGRNADYFTGFPPDVRWERVILTRQELEQIRYIEYDYWIELSGGTRLAIDGARNAVAGKVVAGLTLLYSTGPVKGHINRLKLMKRQAYGRAGLSYLQHRFLAAA